MSLLRRWFTSHREVNRPRRERPARRLGLELLEEREVPTVQYYGGNVLPHVEAQALYLGSKWSQTNSADTATLDRFLGDLTGGAYMDALNGAGYGVGRGTASPGTVDNANIATNATISDASIQARIQADIKSGLLQAPDANRLYVVYVEPNVAVDLGGGQGTTQQGILGYHGAFAGKDAAGRSAVIRYAVVAYPGGSVRNSSMGTSAVDQLTAVTSHELSEAVTDPDVNFARLGWYDPRLGEIGDITTNNPNAYVRLDGYLVQEAADKNDRLLPIAIAAPPTPANPPAPTPSSSVATTTTLYAGPVHYRWFGPATVSLTVTVTPASGAIAPDGTVRLLYNGRVLGTAQVQVVNGVAIATFNVQFRFRGVYEFATQYVGSNQFTGSISNSVGVVV